MITLQEITTSEKLDEYYRFRYRIYNDSEQKGFLKTSCAYDRDQYDDNAIHLGWYKEGKLVGCVRFVRPIGGNDPLYCFTHMPHEAAEPARKLLEHYQEKDLPFVEVSRICIDPNRRDFPSLRDFVLATMAKSHELGLDHALFTCFKPHAPFWLRMGFRMFREAGDFKCRRNEQVSVCMIYHYADLPTRILNELPAHSLALATAFALAA